MMEMMKPLSLFLPQQSCLQRRQWLAGSSPTGRHKQNQKKEAQEVAFGKWKDLRDLFLNIDGTLR